MEMLIFLFLLIFVPMGAYFIWLFRKGREVTKDIRDRLEASINGPTPLGPGCYPVQPAIQGYVFAEQPIGSHQPIPQPGMQPYQPQPGMQPYQPQPGMQPYQPFPQPSNYPGQEQPPPYSEHNPHAALASDSADEGGFCPQKQQSYGVV